MRIQSHIWVSAYIRNVEIAGAPALLVRRGEASAGAIYIKVSLLNRTALLFSPAINFSTEGSTDRTWRAEFGMTPIDEFEVDEFLRSQTKFDEDLWIVEVEDPHGEHFLGDHFLAE